MKENGYNTNRASEYYVLSVLYRLDLNAYLTLGNKKAIDTVIDFGDRLCTVDVKGLAGKHSGPWTVSPVRNQTTSSYLSPS